MQGVECGSMNETISILFAGDFAPCRRYEALVLEKGRDIFGDLIDDVSNADLAFLNLESPLCSNGKAILKAGPNLKAHSDCIQAVVGAGFNVIGLANNHIMDFGEDGLNDTLKVCTISLGSGHTKQLTLYIKGFKYSSEVVLIDRFSPQNCLIKGNDERWLVQKDIISPVMSGI